LNYTENLYLGQVIGRFLSKTPQQDLAKLLQQLDGSGSSAVDAYIETLRAIGELAEERVVELAQEVLEQEKHIHSWLTKSQLRLLAAPLKLTTDSDCELGLPGFAESVPYQQTLILR
jgi:hypothetical protein